MVIYENKDILMAYPSSNVIKLKSKKNEMTIDKLAIMVANGFEQVDKRFEQVDKKIDQIDVKLDDVIKRVDVIEDKVDNLDYKLFELTNKVENIEVSLDRETKHVKKRIGVLEGVVLHK